MDLPRSSPRMTTRTSHPLPARNMAACPAELPPPSTITGLPAQTFASVSVAAYAMPAPSSSAPALDQWSPVLRAGRHDDRPGRHLAAVVQPDHVPARLGHEPGHAARIGDASAELLGLHGGEVRQLLSGDAVGEAEVVLDPAGRARLATHRPALEHDGVEPLGRAVHGRGQARPARRPRPRGRRCVPACCGRSARGARPARRRWGSTAPSSTSPPPACPRGGHRGSPGAPPRRPRRDPRGRSTRGAGSRARGTRGVPASWARTVNRSAGGCAAPRPPPGTAGGARRPGGSRRRCPARPRTPRAATPGRS